MNLCFLCSLALLVYFSFSGSTSSQDQNSNSHDYIGLDEAKEVTTIQEEITTIQEEVTTEAPDNRDVTEKMIEEFPREPNPLFDKYVLCVNFNHPHVENIPTFDRIASSFRHKVYMAPLTKETLQWKRDNPGYHLILNEFLHRGWTSYFAFEDCMKQSIATGGYILTNDDIVINEERLATYDPKKIWTQICGGVEKDCMPAAWHLTEEECPISSIPWWAIVAYQGNATKQAAIFFKDLPSRFQDTLAKNMKHLPYPRTSFCSGPADFWYLPTRLKYDFLELLTYLGANRVSRLSLEHNYYIPTEIFVGTSLRMLDSQDNFDLFSDKAYTWSTDQTLAIPVLAENLFMHHLKLSKPEHRAVFVEQWLKYRLEK